MSLGLTDDAINDLSIAEKISNNDPAILTNKAVALSNTGKWDEACNIFEKVITTADRNALPWWLRYAMSLLEVNRSIEGVAFLQRTMNRFPEEAECKAFACALYTSLGQTQEAGRYWKQMLPSDRELYSQKNFVKDKLLWGPKAYTSFDEFLLSKYSKLE
jgi:tetratricopeptide (TPR) repeat protein